MNVNPEQLEDNWYDVVCKASAGRNIDPSSIHLDQLDELHPPQAVELAGIAHQLELDPEALVHLAHTPEIPNIPQPEGLTVFSSQWKSMVVNAYLLQVSPGHAVLFDTGTDPNQILQFLKSRNLVIDHIFITHTHKDHILCLPDLIAGERVSSSVWTPALEPLDQAQAFDYGTDWNVGQFRMESRLTAGHAVGGATYVVFPQSSESPVIAVVGDAVFACSMGGGKVDFLQAINTNLKAIMALPDTTVICPGHGCLTSVQHEKQWNPFLAPFFT